MATDSEKSTWGKIVERTPEVGTFLLQLVAACYIAIIPFLPLLPDFSGREPYFFWSAFALLVLSRFDEFLEIVVLLIIASIDKLIKLTSYLINQLKRAWSNREPNSARKP